MARVFVNHVDQYAGRVVSKLFSESLVGATAGPPDGDEFEEGGDALPKTPSKYTVVGTVMDSTALKPDCVAEIVEFSSRDELQAALLQCDVVVYDICEDMGQVEEAAWAVEALHGSIETFSEQKTFICLSTVLTWARTKPLDPEDPDIPFTEEDYRKRRPHPNFKEQVAVEKLVIKLGKTNNEKLTTYVVASGLTYGCGEDIFHLFFKAAWFGNVPALPVFGNGQNVVPMIHVRDLASVVLNIADGKPATRYLVAVDGGQQTLEEIVKTISDNLGNGKVKTVPKDDALLYEDLRQKDYDRLLVNLQIEATFVKESMQVSWVAENGLLENIDKAIREYKETRGLLPLRVCVLGSPQVGKSLVAQQICKHYKLHHVHIKDVIKEEIRRLEQSAARANEDDVDEDDDAQAQKDSEHLALLRESKEKNDGFYEDQHIISFIRRKLKSMPCQNQGFVLDGYPKTYEHAKDVFAADEEEDEDQGDTAAEFDKTTMPEFVICLEASDKFLRDRVMNMPEQEVSGTNNSEEKFLSRLSRYRERNMEDTTVLNYFDELEVHPAVIDIESDQTHKMKATVDAIKKIIGEPRNYGPTPEEKAEMDRIAQEDKLFKETQEREERERQEAEEAAETSSRRGEWRSQLEDVKHEEQEALETQSIPLRNYLLRNVMPTLTQGLIEVCKIRPDDPIDYLAEYLFENNPQIN